MDTIRYVTITPARNEKAFIPALLESLAAQTIRPAACIVVDDGSSDATGELASDFAATHSWVSVIRRENRGYRASGGGVMDAFLDGLRHLNVSDWDFLVKLDADLSFDPHYFERCFAKFNKDAKLGVGGGSICVLRDGKTVVECPGDPPFHVRGATKIYRRACWNQMGGLVRSTGWDTIDELMANQNGWRSYTFRDITLIQHRETGRASSRWQDYVKNGRANYLTGYHPVFMLLKCVRRLFCRPYFLMSLGLGWGFLSAYCKRTPRPVNHAFVKYVHQEQINSLLGKPSLWSEPAP